MATRKLTLKVEGERARRVTVASFLKANRDGLSAAEKRKVRALKPGQEICFGGGAAPWACLVAPGGKPQRRAAARRDAEPACEVGESGPDCLPL